MPPGCRLDRRRKGSRAQDADGDDDALGEYYFTDAKSIADELQHQAKVSPSAALKSPVVVRLPKPGTTTI